MARDTHLGIRLPSDVKMALAEAARDDARTMSSMVEWVLTSWLRDHGYLPTKPQVEPA